MILMRHLWNGVEEEERPDSQAQQPRVAMKLPCGGNYRIHDLFGGARISRICNAYFLPKVFWDPQYENMLGNSLPVGPARETTENYLKYSGCPQ